MGGACETNCVYVHTCVCAHMGVGGAHGRRGEKAQGVKLGPIEKQKPH